MSLARSFRVVLPLLLAAQMLSGCATFNRFLKAWLGDGKEEPKVVTTPRFSETENLRVANDRQYRRMNREKFEEEADLKADAGSLWVMEGQGAYLFAQNQMRMVGDLLNVKIEGGPKSQLQTKVNVISKLLQRLEAPAVRAPANAAAGAKPGEQKTADAKAGDQKAGDKAQEKAPTDSGTADTQAPQKPDLPFAVQTVPTRIVEQLKDGSYRVRGMQPFMIGKREYKVIVTGIVRPEDFDDSGLDAGKLLDPQFDIVSSRKGAHQ